VQTRKFFELVHSNGPNSPSSYKKEEGKRKNYEVTEVTGDRVNLCYAT
jgi:hypothetical protein